MWTFWQRFYNTGKIDNIDFLLNQQNSSELREKNKCKLNETNNSEILLNYGFTKENNDYIYADNNINIYYDNNEFTAISNGDKEQYSLIPTGDYGFYYYNLIKKI